MTHCLVQQGVMKINSRWQREISSQEIVSYYGSGNERENKFGGREETQLVRLQKCHAKSLSFSVIPGFPRLY